MPIISKVIFSSIFLCASLFASIHSTTHAEHVFFLIIDRSDSMKESDPEEIRLDAATLVVDTASQGDRITVIEFGTESKVIIDDKKLDDNSKLKHNICKAINEMHYIKNDHTDIIGALRKTSAKLNEMRMGKTNVNVHTLLLTDGDHQTAKDKELYPNLNRALDEVLESFIVNKIPVHTIALGNKVNTGILHNITNKTNGSYFFAKTGIDLLDIYLKIIIASKNLVSIRRNTFDVWDKTEELYIVLFCSEPGRSLSIIESNGKTIDYSTLNTYWSSKRPRPRSIPFFRKVKRPKYPKYYDLVKIQSPQQGFWFVEADSKEDVQIHALQSAPFEFNVLSPKKSKYVEDEEVNFVCQLKSEPGSDAEYVKNLLESAVINLNVITPKNTTFSARLISDGKGTGMYQFKTSFHEIGDYTYEIAVKLRSNQRGASTWETKRNGIYYVRPYEFSIKIDKVGFITPTPCEEYEIMAHVVKSDLNAKIEKLPLDTKFNAKVFDHQGKKVLDIPCRVSGSLIIVPVLDGIETNLFPGNYVIKISGYHPYVGIKGAEAPFSISNWPEPDISKLSVEIIQIEGSAIVAGEEVKLQANLRNKNGSTLKLNELINCKWQLRSVRYEDMVWEDEVGPISLHILDSSSGGDATTNKFRTKVPYSGRAIVHGEAKMDFVLNLGEKLVEERQINLEINSKEFIVPPRVKLDPEDFIKEVYGIGSTVKDELSLTTYYPKSTILHVAVKPALLQGNEMAMPGGLLNFSQNIKTEVDIDSKQKSIIPFNIRISEGSDGLVQSGTYVCYLTIIDKNWDINKSLAETKISVKMTDWPNKDDFKIAHNLPKSLPLESNILIFENVAFTVNGLPSNAYFFKLLYAPDNTHLRINSQISDRFTVKEIKWGNPLNTSNEYYTVFKRYEDNISKEPFYVGSFFEDGKAEFQFLIEELTLAIEGKGTKTYKNIKTPVTIDIINPEVQ